MNKKLLAFSASILMALGMTACAGPAKGIERTYINDNGELVVVYTNGEEENLGSVKGSQGPKGDSGINGSNGLNGSNGKNGSNGSNGVNGSNGSNGINGSNGSNGINGSNGSNGRDGSNGTNGSNGRDGSQGPQGDSGVQGPQGDSGAQGPQGDSGAQGPQGDSGAQGPKGDSGAQGPQGPEGVPGEDGATWLTGKGAPSNDLGVEGDLYLDTEVGDIYKKSSTEWVKEGNIKGAAGQDGSTWSTGSGAPTNGKGKNGDYYLDTMSFDIYVKVSGVWAKIGNIKGADGQNGSQGEQGETGEQGDPGKDGATWINGEADPTNEVGAVGDFYLNTTTYDLFKKGTSGWSKIGNIKGEDLTAPTTDAEILVKKLNVMSLFNPVQSHTLGESLGYITAKTELYADELVANPGEPMILWDSVNDAYVTVKDNVIDYSSTYVKVSDRLAADDVRLFMVSEEVIPYEDQTYSIYYIGGEDWTENLQVGFDMSDHASTKHINYVRNSDVAQEVIINSGDFAGVAISIDAPKDSVSHRGSATSVKIESIAPYLLQGYNEYGSVEYIGIKKGFVFDQSIDHPNIHCLKSVNGNEEYFDQIKLAYYYATGRGEITREALNNDNDVERQIVEIVELGEGDYVISGMKDFIVNENLNQMLLTKDEETVDWKLAKDFIKNTVVGLSNGLKADYAITQEEIDNNCLAGSKEERRSVVVETGFEFLGERAAENKQAQEEQQQEIVEIIEENTEDEEERMPIGTVTVGGVTINQETASGPISGTPFSFNAVKNEFTLMEDGSCDGFTFTTVDSKGIAFINLNGHTLSYTSSNGIVINSGYNLTVYDMDRSVTTTGSIYKYDYEIYSVEESYMKFELPGEHVTEKGTYVTDYTVVGGIMKPVGPSIGPGILVEGTDTKVQLLGGTIMNVNANNYGGAVWNRADGDTELYLGKYFTAMTSCGEKGGGLCLTAGGVTTMNGASLLFNNASLGAAVYAHSNPTFIMKDGLIANNIGRGTAAAMCTYGGTFELLGGVIRDNYGQSMFWNLDGNLCLDGVIIENNLCKDGEWGGFMIMQATWEGGEPYTTIKGNTKFINNTCESSYVSDNCDSYLSVVGGDFTLLGSDTDLFTSAGENKFITGGKFALSQMAAIENHVVDGYKIINLPGDIIEVVIDA